MEEKLNVLITLQWPGLSSGKKDSFTKAQSMNAFENDLVCSSTNQWSKTIHQNTFKPDTSTRKNCPNPV
jgi:hypothetical protein